jgi:hypothetical protein
LRLRTKAVAYGISGLVLASAVIFSGSALGLLNARSSGVLSILLTDPPSIPNGVSAVYITYSGIQVHAEGLGGGGWVAISGAGTIDTMKLVNLSQTISSGDIPSLTYDLVAFNISGASVDFMGANYSATVGSGRVTVPFVGGLKVNSSSDAAALIDIQPTVLNLGTRSTPGFTLAAGAKALQVPSGDVSDSLKTLGHTFRLQGNGWFESFMAKHSDNVVGSGTTLTANSLSLSVTNSGSDPVIVRMVMVTPATPGGGEEGGALGSVVSGAVFAVQSDGSLKPLSGMPMQVDSLFGNSGYSLSPGTTHQFTYSGTIASLLRGNGIISGDSYYVVVMGSETLSVQTVVAG